jgi:membrane-associated phospholipid phosphatase
MARVFRENVKVGDFLNNTALVFWHVSRIQDICIPTEKHGLVLDEYPANNIIHICLGQFFLSVTRIREIGFTHFIDGASAAAAASALGRCRGFARARAPARRRCLARARTPTRTPARTPGPIPCVS